ncbi:Monocarboxylate transporter 5 [Gryllus bimaculatus]|nr:Monocarboxylate transporter 5 [Gryllus bimaculatus]
MMDFTLLKDPIFILFTVSNFLTSIGYNVPYLYVAAGWLLAAIGFANTIGRIVLGYISDKPWVDRLLAQTTRPEHANFITPLSPSWNDHWIRLLHYMGGWLYDATGSYNPGFIVAGVTMALSGVMLFVIPPVQRRLAAKRSRQEALELQPTTATTLTTTAAANGDALGVHC